MNKNIIHSGPLGDFINSVRRYKRIPDSHHLISDDGRIFSMKGMGKELKLSTDRDGYRVTSLKIGNVRKQYKIHRLVMIYFGIGEVKESVNHINGIKSDNRVENLDWVTHTENIRHAVENGLKPSTIDKRMMFEIIECHKSGISIPMMSSYFKIPKKKIIALLNGEYLAPLSRDFLKPSSGDTAA